MSTHAGGPLRRDTEEPLAQQIADRLEALVSDGTLRPGARVPSVRHAKRQFGVSTGTVLDAYGRLEARGIVEARPRSGYFVRGDPAGRLSEPLPSRPPPGPMSVEPPLPVRMITAAHTPGIVRLGAAVPDPSLLPTGALDRLLARALREEGVASHAYAAPSGHPKLRREIARRLFEAGAHVDPDDTVVTNGANEAVQLALRAVTKPGDVVAVEAPTYYGLLDALRSASLRALPIASCTRDGVSLEALSAALASGEVRACAFVTSFSNPVGAVMSDAKKAALAALLAEHEVPLIEDDVYGELAFDGHRPSAVKAFDETGSVLYCSSFSKTISPGWRIGWIHAGRWHAEVTRLKLELNHCTPWAPQRAIADYLASGAHDRHLRRLRRAYREQVARTTAAVADHFPAGTRVTRPRGGHLLWVELPAEVDSVELFEAALLEGVSIAPGVLFGSSESFRNFLRLNCAIPWSPEVEHAIARVGRLAHRQMDTRARDAG